MCPFYQPLYYAIDQKGNDAMNIKLDYSKKAHIMCTFKNYFCRRQLVSALFFLHNSLMLSPFPFLMLSPFPDSKSRIIMQQTRQIRKNILADNASASATIGFVVIFIIGFIAG